MNYLDEKRFISILSDYGFKITFGNESNTLFLRKAIQALIRSNIPIISVELNRNEISGFTAASGGGLFDISCTDEAGNHYIIEMQVENLKTFIRRSTFYAAHRYASIVRKGKWRFKKIKKLYVISILDGVVYPDSKEHHHIGCLRNQHGELMSDQITQVILELGKWDKQPNEIESDLDKLIYFMKTTEGLKVNETFTPPPFWSEEWIQNAITELDMSKMSPEQREYAERQIVKAVEMAEYYKEQKQIIVEERRAKQKAEREQRKAEREKKKVQREKQKLEQERIMSVIKLLQRATAPKDIAEILNIPLKEVLKIKEESDKK